MAEQFQRLGRRVVKNEQCYRSCSSRERASCRIYVHLAARRPCYRRRPLSRGPRYRSNNCSYCNALAGVRSRCIAQSTSRKPGTGQELGRDEAQCGQSRMHSIEPRRKGIRDELTNRFGGNEPRWNPRIRTRQSVGLGWSRCIGIRLTCIRLDYVEWGRGRPVESGNWQDVARELPWGLGVTGGHVGGGKGESGSGCSTVGHLGPKRRLFGISPANGRFFLIIVSLRLASHNVATAMTQSHHFHRSLTAGCDVIYLHNNNTSAWHHSMTILFLPPRPLP